MLWELGGVVAATMKEASLKMVQEERDPGEEREGLGGLVHSPA